MKESASLVGSVKYTKKGKDAVSYEIVPSTLSVSLDANGNWVGCTTTSVDGSIVAVISFEAYKVTGSKREKFSDCYWLGGSVNPIQTSSYTRYLSKTDTSVDITLCELTWTSAHLPKAGAVLDRVTVSVNKAGKNGESGKSVVCQYSADKSNWHDGFKTGDVWMRTKVEGGSWGDAMRVVGEKGKNGEYTKYDFAISAQEKTSGVTIAPSDVSAWSDTPLSTTSDKSYLWMRITKYDSNGIGGTPTYVRINGKDGASGTSISIKGSFDSSDNLPSSGAKLGDCYIINGELWVYTAESTSGSKNGFINAGNIKGEPGISATQYYYHIAWCDSIETKTDSSGNKTYEYKGFTTSNPSGKAYAYMGICYTDSDKDPVNGSLYKWNKVEGKSAVTYEIALDTTSVVANGDTRQFLTTNLGNYRFLRHEGDRIEECDIYNTFLYLVLYIGYDGKVSEYATKEDSSDIYSIMTANIGDSADVAMMKFFWYDKAIQGDTYDYISELKSDELCGVPTSDMDINILASNTFTVVKQGTNGKRGSSGAVWRQHKDFVEAAYSYQAGGNDERFLDVVYIDKVWYRCIKSYESTGINDERNKVGTNAFSTYWDSADMSGFTFIATDFLLAENAQINLFGSQEINLLKDVSSGEIFGSYRVPNGNGDNGMYALWLGAATGENAPFSVTKNGRSKIADADITGKITATSGSIGGFSINSNTIGSESLAGTSGETTNSGMLLTDSEIIFSKDKRLVNIGALDYTGIKMLGNFDDSRTKGSDIDKYGLRIAVGGGLNKNVAISLSAGNIAALAVDTLLYLGDYVTSLSVPTKPASVSIDRGVGAAVISTQYNYRAKSSDKYTKRTRDVDVTFPEMHKYDDGHVIHLKRGPDNGSWVYLHPAGCWRLNEDGTETFADTVILYDGESFSTSLGVKSAGDAMTFVFFYDMIVTVEDKEYKGVWVQYKHPRDW